MLRDSVNLALEKQSPVEYLKTSNMGKTSFANIVFDDIIISNSSNNFKRVC